MLVTIFTHIYNWIAIKLQHHAKVIPGSDNSPKSTVGMILGD